MIKLAQKWKHKDFFKAKEPLPHYGDIGYSHAELKFLSGIRFQTGLSKVITPLESLFFQVTSTASEQPPHEHIEDKYGLCPLI